MSNADAQGVSASAQAEFAREGKRVQEWVEKIQALPDSDARAMLEECLGAVLTFYGHGLERILGVIGALENGDKIRDALLADPGIAGLLLIHGLHPVPLKDRLATALEKVRPYMQSHGGDVELVSLEDDRAVLRLEGHCKTCPSSTVTLELAVRSAIEEACPDLEGYEVLGIPPIDAATNGDGFVHVPKAAPEWMILDGVIDLTEGKCAAVHPQDEPLLVCRVAGRLYAYRDRCPGCNLPLHLGGLRDGVLSCAQGHHFDAGRAGVGLNGSGALHLDPVPLLDKGGEVKIALARREPAAATP